MNNYGSGSGGRNTQSTPGFVNNEAQVNSAFNIVASRPTVSFPNILGENGAANSETNQKGTEQQGTYQKNLPQNYATTPVADPTAFLKSGSAVGASLSARDILVNGSEALGGFFDDYGHIDNSPEAANSVASVLTASDPIDFGSDPALVSPFVEATFDISDIISYGF